MNVADDIAIAAQGVSFAYDDGVVGLTDVDFAARKGEFVAIVGSNGSGKTTLMKVLVRLLKPSAGSVILGGQELRKVPAGELYARVGMVFQNPADQLFAPTVEQDVAVGPRNLGLNEAEVQRRVEESLADAEALPLRKRPIHHLSFGEQKRVCLAGVLAMQPEILVLDEPTAGLDGLAESHMVELLLRLNRQKRITMILTTHSVDLLPVLADRIYVLARSRVLRQGTPREILSDPKSAASAGLRLPLLTQLFLELEEQHGLRPGEMPLTLEQARKQIVAWSSPPGAAGAGGAS